MRRNENFRVCPRNRIQGIKANLIISTKPSNRMIKQLEERATSCIFYHTSCCDLFCIYVIDKNFERTYLAPTPWRAQLRALFHFYCSISGARFLSPPQLKNSLNNENTVKSTAFWLSVWKKWCLEKGIAEEIENYEPTQLNTLLERSNAKIKSACL